MDKEFVWKKFIGTGLTLAALLVAFAALTWSGAYSRSTAGEHSFSVSAEGETVAIPDVARFTFSVITQGGKDIASLEATNAEKVNNAVAFLKENGIEDKDIQTESYNLSPRYTSCAYRPGEVCPPAQIVGYEITQTTSVKARDFSKLGDLLSGVVAKGVNSVSSLNFEIDDPTAVEQLARSQAISKAHEKAVQIAGEGGFRLGRLISVSESNYPTPVYSVLGMGAAETAVPAARVSVEPGSQKVTVTVNLIYEIR